VIFAEDGNGLLAFNLLGREGNVSVRTSSRLADAIRQSDKTAGKELKTILIIDDEPVLLELLTKTLLREGYCIWRASDGLAGVESATKYLPDIIILDFTMPGFNGIQVVEKLRAQPLTNNIPILINTGHHPQRRRTTAARGQGAIHHLENGAGKPACGIETPGRVERRGRCQRSEPMTGNKILIIEDNQMNLELATDLLR